MKSYSNDYDQLMRDILSKGQNWSQQDLALAKQNPDAGRSIYTQKQNFVTAQDNAGRNAANAAAEGIRQQYGGYSGGKNGGGFSLSTKYAPPVENYTSPYSSQIDALMDALMNTEKFQYNPGADPSYQAYAEKYRTLGSQARENTMGSAAAMTGGQLNSYAMTAGQQAQNGYNAQLSDKIPALEQLAYEMYLGDLGQKRNNLSALQGQDATHYGRFRDERGDALTNYQLNYGVGQDDLKDQRYHDETAYNRQQDGLDRKYQADRDLVGDQRYQNEWGYQTDRDQISDKRYDQEWQYGVEKDQLTQAAKAVTSGGSSSGASGKRSEVSSSGGTQKGSTILGSEAWLGDIYKQAGKDGVGYIRQNYKQLGIPYRDIKEYTDAFSQWQERSSSTGAWDNIDRKSVTELGLGPVSRPYLDELTKKGEIEAYVDAKTGELKFKKTGTGAGNQKIQPLFSR